jgi:hypothetical protein
MHHRWNGVHYCCMTSSAASGLPAGPATRRLVLISTSGRTEAAVRRIRLARLRLEDREVARAERFSHLKRSHD